MYLSSTEFADITIVTAPVYSIPFSLSIFEITNLYFLPTKTFSPFIILNTLSFSSSVSNAKFIWLNWLRFFKSYFPILIVFKLFNVILLESL